ncbi:glycerophosphodiester phosphodiesterase, partial [Halobacteriales archaeon QS_4_62_28]
AEWVEFDVRRCGTGELVVIHDETVDRVTDGTGRVDELSRAELASLNVLDTGTGVPALDIVLKAVPESTGLNIELKEQDLAADVAEVLSAHDHRVLVSSFDPDALAALRAVADLPRALLFAEAPTANLDRARELGIDAVHPHWDLCSASFVQRAHEAGFIVNCWTIDSEAAAEQAQAAGVDGIASDYPRFCDWRR